MPTDLVLLAADKDIEYGIRGLLARCEGLGIRPLNSKTYVHSQHDPGCATKAHEFLRPFAADFAHALVIFDHQGSGRERWTATELEDAVGAQLAANGWGDRAAAIVIDPEIETWVFGRVLEVERCIRWGGPTRLKAWLHNRGLWRDGDVKPHDPKGALEAALRQVRRPRSPSVYESLARSVDFAGCQDEAFNRFRTALREWFPLPAASESDA